MNKDIVEKTKKTAELYFKGVADERRFDLWMAFDPDLAKDLSLFITGQMYAREKIPHRTRQLITVACLTVLLSARLLPGGIRFQGFRELLRRGAYHEMLFALLISATDFSVASPDKLLHVIGMRVSTTDPLALFQQIESLDKVN